MLTSRPVSVCLSLPACWPTSPDLPDPTSNHAPVRPIALTRPSNGAAKTGSVPGATPNQAAVRPCSMGQGPPLHLHAQAMVRPKKGQRPERRQTTPPSDHARWAKGRLGANRVRPSCGANA
eukprot:12876296-Alexandrium_andersonii.AAC.1